ncbi:hypothetical protein GCM10009557_01380 [Virgisporangium ochraceum]|uniref:HTH iclR-type domain-containing protein n=1 Tax=Virgisporangium ochraceum TaxID=65505 RepID=A0A8J4EGR9_9ACTN|nr:MarR family transcriptional regulator [Virgisporangium ochraceum]GIJ74169.1 hypothetical protein Voc01_090860 [Virgisporangium ochraceum]
MDVGPQQRPAEPESTNRDTRYSGSHFRHSYGRQFAMSENTTTNETAAETVARVLAEHPDGVTTRALAKAAHLGQSTVQNALTAMEAAGSATRNPGPPDGNRKVADVWTSATPTTGDTDEVPDEITAAPDAEPSGQPADETASAETAPDEATPDGSTPDEATPADAPVSGAPVGSADHFKIVMVAGVLGDHPDGVSAADVADESGLRAAIVGRVLAAMELAGAAVRKPAAEGDETGPELWLRGEADLTTVSLVAVPTWTECPTCGHRTRVRNGVPVRRGAGGAPGQNSDGQPTLGKNGLRTIVRDFLNAHPGHEFTATTIAKEINRSGGAIRNALDKLHLAGEAVLVTDAPMTYTAARTTATDAGSDSDDSAE